MVEDSGITFEVIPTFEIVGGPEMLQRPDTNWHDLLDHHINSRLSHSYSCQRKPEYGCDLSKILVPRNPLPEYALHALLHDLLEDFL